MVVLILWKDKDASVDDATMKEFEMAFERLCSGLVTHSGPRLLAEGMKRSKISRGFWYFVPSLKFFRELCD